MYYEDEKKTIIIDIVCFIFTFLSILSIVELVQEYLAGNYDLIVLLLICLLLLLFIITFAYIGLANIINTNYNRKIANIIKTNGKKVKGEIISIEKINDYDNKISTFKRASFFRTKILYYNKKNIPYYHYAKVKYTYNEKEYIINTPYLIFYPKELENNRVDVYVYNDECYVDNFNLKKEKIVKEKSKNHKTTMEILIAFMIVLITIGMIVYLNIINEIGDNLVSPLIITVMLIYVVIGGIIYIKKMSE